MSVTSNTARWSYLERVSMTYSCLHCLISLTLCISWTQSKYFLLQALEDQRSITWSDIDSNHIAVHHGIVWHSRQYITVLSGTACSTSRYYLAQHVEHHGIVWHSRQYITVLSGTAGSTSRYCLAQHVVHHGIVWHSLQYIHSDIL